MNDMHGLETTLYTSMSVALETLSTMLDQVPAELGGPEAGYMKGVVADARHEIDLFLEDRDIGRIQRVQSIITEANSYLGRCR